MMAATSVSSTSTTSLPARNVAYRTMIFAVVLCLVATNTLLSSISQQTAYSNSPPQRYYDDAPKDMMIHTDGANHHRRSKETPYNLRDEKYNKNNVPLLVSSSKPRREDNRPQPNNSTSTTIRRHPMKERRRNNKKKTEDIEQKQDWHACVPRKVSSSAHYNIAKSVRERQQKNHQQQNLPNMTKSPNANTTTVPPPPTVPVHNFTIIRDPLERLWSAYWNKCLHQIEREPTQCPNYPNARLYPPPSFEEFVTTALQQKDNFDANSHFIAMSKVCDIDQYQYVLNMSPTNHIHNNNNNNNNSSLSFAHDIAKIWTSLGADPELVEKYYPTAGERSLQFYHSGAANGTAQHYQTCSTLLLSMELLRDDYQGKYKSYFPIPEWASKRLEEDCSTSVGTIQ